MSVAQRKKHALNLKRLQSNINRKNKAVVDAVNEAYMLGQIDAIKDIANIFLWALKTKEGFGAKRLGRVYEEAVFITSCINDEKTGLTMDDIVQALKEENGLVVR